jgi:hypothetical protein
MKVLLPAFACFFSFTGFCQGRLTVDKTEIKIGDQIQATIQVDLSDGREWIGTEAIWPDTVKGIEIIHGPVWNKDNSAALQATWTVAVFDTGWVRIPALPIVLKQRERLDTLYTNDVPVKVLPVEPDSTGLRPIKEINVQPFSLSYYKRYLPHFFVFLLVLAGLFLWYRHRTKEKVLPVPITLPPLPHEWANQALDDLAEKKLWQQGEVKEHYTFLTAILREYLERRYGIHALEQTSDEIIDQLRKRELSQTLLTDTEQLLSVADLIKFAKADPGMDLHAATIERVRSFVTQTTPVAAEPVIDPPKSVADELVE